MAGTTNFEAIVSRQESYTRVGCAQQSSRDQRDHLYLTVTGSMNPVLDGLIKGPLAELAQRKHV